MAKKKQNADKGNFNLEENLALTNKELISNWAKLASLIRTTENIEWEDAKTKAIALVKDTDSAIEYIERARAGEIKSSKSVSKPSQEPTQKNQPKEQSTPRTEKKVTRRDRFSMNYRRLTKLIPDLERRLLSGEEIWGKSSETTYMPLNIELTHRDRNGSSFYLAMSHNYIQNGDLVPDPDMVIRFDPEMEIVEALSFQNQLGYQQVYDNIYERNKVNLSLKKSMNSFLETWLKNLLTQEHEVKWEHIEPNKPIARKTKAGSASELLSPPDISYMDDVVVGGIKEYINRLMLDTVIQQYLAHVEGKQPMRAIARYFAMQRIDDAPLPNFPVMAYPTESELKDDYNALVDFQKRSRQADRMAESMAHESTAKSQTSDKEAEEIAKHWKKLAKVIREREPSLTVAESEEKARELKSNDKAVDYLLKGVQGSNRKQVAELKKVNYQKLLRLIPDINDRLKNDTVNGVLYPKNDEVDFRYKIESAAPISKAKQQFAIQNEKGEGSLLVVVTKVRKQAHVSTHADNLLESDNFLETVGFTIDDQYQVNMRFGQWLDKMIKQTNGVQWDDRNNGNSDPEQRLTAEDFHIFKIGDLVTRHTGMGGNEKQIYRVKELLDLQPSDSDLKVVIEESLGIIDESIDQGFLKLALSIDDYDPNTFDWKNKELGELNRDSSIAKRESEKKELKDMLRQYPIVLEWTEGLGDDMQGFKSLAELQVALIDNGYTENPNETYIKNKVWLRNYPSYIRIDVSKVDGDYDPNQVAILDFLKQYEQSFDWDYWVSEELEDPSKNQKTQMWSTITDDYDQNLEKMTYNLAGSKDEVEKLLRKYPIVYEFSQTKGYVNRGYKTFQGLRKAIAELGASPDEKDSPTMNVIYLKGDDSGFVIQVSSKKGDFNPETQDLEVYLRDTFKGRLDWSYFTSRLPRKERTLSKSAKEELEKAKKDAEDIPLFELGKVKLTEQHKRAGLTQKDINWINKHKQGLVLTPRKNMTNNTKSFAADMTVKAKLPGKRISATGRIYYEGRSNRSDLGKDGL